MAGDLAKIVIDVVRLDREDLAGLVDVREELLSGQVLAATNDLRQASVRDLDVPALSALPAELEADSLAANGRVPAADSPTSVPTASA